MKTYLPRSWISPKLVPGPSKIHGDGVIAARPIEKGEKLMEFGGETISPADFETEIYRARSIWQVGDGVYLALREDDPEPSLDENLNHSCDPNAWLADEVTLVARRDIAAGEEITLDQGTWNFDEDDYAWDQDYCSCGARQCRNRLTENDWQLADLQERYKGHFHPFVWQMIEAGRR
jgi:hypothetical protein